MEVAGNVFRPVPCFSVAGVDNHNHSHHHRHSSNLCFSGGISSTVVDIGNRVSKLCLKSRKFSGLSSSGFSDNGHMSYYHAPVRCGGKKEKVEKVEKGKGSGVITSTKKKLKLLKGLSKDLSVFSELGFGLDPYNVLVGEPQGKIVSEATDALLKQLQQLRAEEKELKRKKKLEKAQLKAERMRNMPESESSSSSGSSDSECGEVIQMSRLRKEAFVEPIVHELQAGTQEESTPALSSSLAQEGNSTNMESSFEDRSMGNLKVEYCSKNSSTTGNLEVDCCSGSSTSISNVVCVNNSLATGALGKRIEVCMGGKCKKSGAAELLGEFEKAIGVEGTVVGCKCMGKCRDGPNVRVLNRYESDGVDTAVVDDSVRTPANPLCIGVGLADVGVILANLFGEDGTLVPAVV